MAVSADISLQGGDAAQRDRARRTRYVLCQAAGWGSLFTMGIWATVVLPNPDSDKALSVTIAYVTMWTGFGLLLSHAQRPFIGRWRWKQLGWRPLFPRIIGMSVVASAVWCLAFYGYIQGILREPWPAKVSPVLLIALCWFQYAILMAGWLCLYFFYHLFERLNRSEIERFQLMTSVKEAELRALKSQVNPHFIFNALNSLRALIDDDPARARTAVTQLANLLRYSLQSGQLETVPFEDELGVVNDYLALEQVRHEERLRLALDIAPDALRLPIPPMLLQTLVENAVKYGISPRPEGGEISIVARNEGGALRIQVSNPGEIAHEGRASSTGMGLSNAAQRLRLIFGERATLRLRSDRPAVVVAEAVIPLPQHP
jgi:signal transduction histidine kinase